MDASANSTTMVNDGWSQSSTCLAVEAAGRSAGRAFGLAESMSRTLASLLGRQAREKFAEANAPGRETLDRLARAFATDQLGELGDRLVSASGWDEWLAGVVAPPPAAGLPAYTRDLDINLEPAEPSIDVYLQVGLRAGGSSIVHIRLQKAYQPNLDEHLYQNSRKFERKHGKMPMVAVFLMWPPAEGPGMTGRFQARNAAGKVTSTFTYTIHRAWEMMAEEVTQSPGTMMLAPLTKGARQRMPEIVRLIKEGLARNQATPETCEKAWAAAYWSMGLTCNLDEAHRALGDMLPLIQNTKDYLAAKGHAFVEAYSSAQQEGRLQAARELVIRQATARFGPDLGADAAIASITEPAELEALASRVLSAAERASLLIAS